MAKVQTAVHEAPQADPDQIQPAAFRALDDAFQYLSVDQLRASLTNPRKHFDPTYIADLARSVAEKGVIEPLVVRPVVPTPAFDEPYEIVAGECRFRAAKQAQISHVPVVIRAYTDEQALEIQLIENLHRTNLTPLEQARGYRALIDTNPTKFSADAIAARVGMSPAWVWDRLKLLDLVPDGQQLLEAERISIGHAILIARLKAVDQQRVLDPDPVQDGMGGSGREGLWCLDHGHLEEVEDVDDDATADAHDAARRNDPYLGLKPVSVRELERWIATHIRFDVAHAAQAQPLDFEAVAQAVADAEAAPGRGKKVVAITFDSYLQPAVKDADERTYGPRSWRRADGTEKTQLTQSYPQRLVDAPRCDHAVLGVVVAGSAHYGESFDVCLARDKCRVHWAAEIKEREKNQKLREAGKGKQAETRERKAENSYEAQRKQAAEERARWDTLKPHALAAVAAKIKVKPATDKLLDEILLDRSGTNTTKLFRQLLGGRVTRKNFGRAVEILLALDRAWSLEEFSRHAKKYGVDVKALEKRLAAADAGKAKAEAKR